MKLITSILILACLFLSQCIKKEDVAPPVMVDLKTVDLSGEWNGYKYTDLNGLVPLEIIKIERIDSNYYVATKLLGDLAVPTGYVTWRGSYNANPFNVELQAGNGRIFSFYSSKMTVISNDVLSEEFFGTFFVRRVDLVID